MADIYPVYLALRDVMLRAAPGMKIAKDTQGDFTLNVPTATLASKDPVWFGSVRLIQNRVGYYLPPLAMKEGRDIAVPEGLQKLAQSKTCFMIRDIDTARLAELEAITRSAAQAF